MIGSSLGEVTKLSVLGRAVGEAIGLMGLVAMVLPRGEIDGEVEDAILCEASPQTDIGAI
jgi:hypothetical protein